MLKLATATAIGLLAVSPLAACTMTGSTDSMASSPRTERTVVDLAADSPAHSTLVAAVQAAGLVGLDRRVKGA